MKSRSLKISDLRPLPVLLPALRDELLSSWLYRHANFYGISGGRLLHHCGVDARPLRAFDLELSATDQIRIAHMFRSDPRALRQMMQVPTGCPSLLIATRRPMQICRRCCIIYGAAPETKGAQLRCWMEGWRVSCRSCGSGMDDCRPMDLLNQVARTERLLANSAMQAAEGELIMERAIRHKQLGHLYVALMRSLLLPRARPLSTSPAADVPRLLEVVVPEFDEFLHFSHPGFRRPGTLLLPMSVRVPVLAGLVGVVRQPARWAEHLLAEVDEIARPGLAACLAQIAN